MLQLRTNNNASIEATTPHQWLILPLMVAVAAILAVAYSIEETRMVLESRDRFILDRYQQEGRKTLVRDDIVILAIDDASMKLDTLWPEELEASQALQQMKQRYPFPRTVWAALADRLFAAGAKMIFLDLSFATAGPNPAEDRALHEAMEKYPGKIVLGAKFDEMSGNTVSLSVPNDVILGPDGWEKYKIGLLNFFSTDGDGVVRALFPRMKSDLAQRLMSNDKSIPDPDERPIPHISTVIGEAMRPGITKDLPGPVAFRYGNETNYPGISLHEVFIDSFWKENFNDGAFFQDRIVMVGAFAQHLQDFQPTPFGDLVGVRLHAHALTALLAGEFLQAAPWWWVVTSLASGLAIAWMLMAAVRQPLLIIIGAVAAIVGMFYGGLWAFNELSVEVSPLPFSLALGLCGLTGIASDSYLKMRANRKLSQYLARYTSPELVREMMRDRKGIFTTLKGQKKVVTILFSDVRGFTSMSETMEPAAMVAQLNQYLKTMVAAIVANRGLVDKFIGDAVMASWGPLRTTPSEEGLQLDAVNAVKAALAMRKELALLNQRWISEGLETFSFGIGIHQGEVVSGNIGSDQKMDLTVIGDNVNLASRLEGVTKEYGVDLIISGAVRSQIGSAFYLRSADLVKVKGKKRPVDVYAVLGAEGDPMTAGLPDYETGVKAYREGRFTEALASFNLAADQGLNDNLTTMYQSRCEKLILTPPEVWDGTYEMTKK